MPCVCNPLRTIKLESGEDLGSVEFRSRWSYSSDDVASLSCFVVTQVEKAFQECDLNHEGRWETSYRPALPCLALRSIPRNVDWSNWIKSLHFPSILSHSLRRLLRPVSSIPLTALYSVLQCNVIQCNAIWCHAVQTDFRGVQDVGSAQPRDRRVHR